MKALMLYSKRQRAEYHGNACCIVDPKWSPDVAVLWDLVGLQPAADLHVSEQRDGCLGLHIGRHVNGDVWASDGPQFQREREQQPIHTIKCNTSQGAAA